MIEKTTEIELTNQEFSFLTKAVEALAASTAITCRRGDVQVAVRSGRRFIISDNPGQFVPDDGALLFNDRNAVFLQTGGVLPPIDPRPLGGVRTRWVGGVRIPWIVRPLIDRVNALFKLQIDPESIRVWVAVRRTIGVLDGRRIPYLAGDNERDVPFIIPLDGEPVWASPDGDAAIWNVKEPSTLGRVPRWLSGRIAWSGGVLHYLNESPDYAPAPMVGAIAPWGWPFAITWAWDRDLDTAQFLNSNGSAFPLDIIRQDDKWEALIIGVSMAPTD